MVVYEIVGGLFAILLMALGIAWAIEHIRVTKTGKKKEPNLFGKWLRQVNRESSHER